MVALEKLELELDELEKDKLAPCCKLSFNCRRFSVIELYCLAIYTFSLKQS